MPRLPERLANDGEKPILSELKDLLNQIRLPTHAFQMCYQEVVRRYERPSELKLLSAKLSDCVNDEDNRLPKANPKEKDEFLPAEMADNVSVIEHDSKKIAPMLEFAWRVAKIEPNIETTNEDLKKLADWVERIIYPKALLEDLEEDLKKESELRKQKRFYRFVIDVPETGSDINYHLYQGLEVWKCGNICCKDVSDERSVEQAVRYLIEAAEACLKEEIFCEFILSLNVLLEWQVDQWKYIDLDKNTVKFGSEHSVVLRCSSRKKHAKRCAEISQTIDKNSVLKIFWAPNKQPNLSLDDLINGKHAKNCVGIAIAPKPKNEANNNKVFRDIVMDGFPFALWPHGDLEGVFKRRFSEKLGQCDLYELPHKIKEIRRKNSHWSISVLWDDHLPKLMTPLG